MAARPDQAEANDPVAASSLDILAGIWLIISPFIFHFWKLTVPTWNSIAVGIAVVILSAVRAAAPLRHVGLSWVNFLLGVWLIISPWVLGYSTISRLVWNHVVLGIIVAVLAACSALMVPAATSPIRRFRR